MCLDKKIFIFFILIFLVLVSTVHSYSLDCEIDPVMYKYEGHDYVTTKSFNLTITLTNIGNKTFPVSDLNVTIFNPKQEIVASYHSFNYSLPYELTTGGGNKSYSYTPPWEGDPKSFALFELSIRKGKTFYSSLLLRSTQTYSSALFMNEHPRLLIECPE